MIIKQKGFSLIEVMIVFSIILLLAAILIPIFHTPPAPPPSRYKVGQECEILGEKVVIARAGKQWYDVIFKSGLDQSVVEVLLRNCEDSR